MSILFRKFLKYFFRTWNRRFFNDRAAFSPVCFVAAFRQRFFCLLRFEFFHGRFFLFITFFKNENISSGFLFSVRAAFRPIFFDFRQLVGWISPKVTKSDTGWQLTGGRRTSGRTCWPGRRLVQGDTLRPWDLQHIKHWIIMLLSLHWYQYRDKNII